ncbi:MAG TPA: transposase [bacterium]|nr:transposase [bacterium]
MKKKVGIPQEFVEFTTTNEGVIPMKKRIYRTMSVNAFQPCTVRREDVGGRLVVAVDIAKVDMVAAFAAADGRILTTVRWKAPTENTMLLSVLRQFRAAEMVVEVVMEPSGSYGDVLRNQLQADGFPVFMVSGKRTFDAREVYDGVPSLHDAKSAAIIAKLHFDGISKRFVPPAPERRQLRAAITIMDLHQQRYLQLVGHLEGLLARHWPELPSILELTSASLMALLARIGGPADVAVERDRAARLLHGQSHGLMDRGNITAVLDSAASSVGLPLVGLERDALMATAAEAHRSLRAFKVAKTTVEKLSQTTPATALAPVVGQATAAVVLSDVGDARSFPCTAAYLKAMGLNLKEKSSGTLKGQLKLTKRGSSRVRQYLWLAVYRWIQKDAIANRWYQHKKQRDGGRSSRAAVALMRKLAKALFHVARGAVFDSSKLFDVRRLGLPA